MSIFVDGIMRNKYSHDKDKGNKIENGSTGEKPRKAAGQKKSSAVDCEKKVEG